MTLDTTVTFDITVAFIIIVYALLSLLVLAP
jgi:hypothetical protein